MKYIRNNLFVLRNILGEFLLFPISEQQNSFQGGIKLNYMAKQIWDYLAIPLDICSIVEKITSEYEISYDEVMHDVKELIDRFIENDIIVAVDDLKECNGCLSKKN